MKRSTQSIPEYLSSRRWKCAIAIGLRQWSVKKASPICCVVLAGIILSGRPSSVPSIRSKRWLNMSFQACRRESPWIKTATSMWVCLLPEKSANELQMAQRLPWQ